MSPGSFWAIVLSSSAVPLARLGAWLSGIRFSRLFCPSEDGTEALCVLTVPEVVDHLLPFVCVVPDGERLPVGIALRLALLYRM